jgi:hypothetical protein
VQYGILIILNFLVECIHYDDDDDDDDDDNDDDNDYHSI